MLEVDFFFKLQAVTLHKQTMEEIKQLNYGSTESNPTRFQPSSSSSSSSSSGGGGSGSNCWHCCCYPDTPITIVVFLLRKQAKHSLI